jgi:hypothetical protein
MTVQQRSLVPADKEADTPEHDSNPIAVRKSAGRRSIAQ